MMANVSPTESLSSSSPRGGYGYFGTAQRRRDSAMAVSQGWANLRADAPLPPPANDIELVMSYSLPPSQPAR
eukprot:13681360-Alexandrium_andersonii.AAC.1